MSMKMLFGASSTPVNLFGYHKTTQAKNPTLALTLEPEALADPQDQTQAINQKQ